MSSNKLFNQLTNTEFSYAYAALMRTSDKLKEVKENKKFESIAKNLPPIESLVFLQVNNAWMLLPEQKCMVLAACMESYKMISVHCATDIINISSKLQIKTDPLDEEINNLTLAAEYLDTIAPMVGKKVVKAKVVETKDKMFNKRNYNEY